MPPETGTEKAVIKNTELCFSLWDPKHAQYRDYRGMKENPVGISQTLDVPHVGWNAVDASQLLRWVQNFTQTGCNEGAHQGTRTGICGAQMHVCWKITVLLILRTCLITSSPCCHSWLDDIWLIYPFSTWPCVRRSVSLRFAGTSKP